MRSGIEGIKRRIPWWARIAAKVVLARLPVSAALWQRIGLFSSRGMLDPDYAIEVFGIHYELAGSPPEGFTFMELGPGDSLASAVIGHAFGASRCWLVDAGAYAAEDIGIYRGLLDHLAGLGLNRSTEKLRGARGLDELLEMAGAIYMGEGLASLAAIPSASCDFVFSQVALEHIRKSDFFPIMAEIHRILKPDGISSHEIDFRDHLGGGLNNLRFSESVWEAPWFAARSGFYTNRLRPSELLALIAAADFQVEVVQDCRWARSPIATAALAPDFAGASEEDLRIWDLRVRLTKSPSAAGAK